MQQTRERPTDSSADAGIRSDETLIHRVVCNDPAAQEEFVDRYTRLIYMLLHKNAIPRQDQDDIFVQVFVHLWDQNYRRLRQWKGTTKRFSAFLSVVVQHLIDDHRRHQFRHKLVNREEDIEPISNNPEPFENFVCARQQKEAVDHILRELNLRDAEVILRKHYFGQSYRDMANALNTNVSSVGVFLSRAEKRLKKKLLAQYPDLFESNGRKGS